MMCVLHKQMQFNCCTNVWGDMPLHRFALWELTCQRAKPNPPCQVMKRDVCPPVT